MEVAETAHIGEFVDLFQPPLPAAAGESNPTPKQRQKDAIDAPLRQLGEAALGFGVAADGSGLQGEDEIGQARIGLQFDQSAGQRNGLGIAPVR